MVDGGSGGGSLERYEGRGGGLGRVYGQGIRPST